MHESMHGNEHVSASASPFNQPKNPAMSATLEHQPYAFSTDVIGWLQDAWELGRKSFVAQFILMMSLGLAATVTGATVFAGFGGVGFALGFEELPGMVAIGVGATAFYVIVLVGYLLAWAGSFLALENAARDDGVTVSELFRTTIAIAPRLVRMSGLVFVLSLAAVTVVMLFSAGVGFIMGEASVLVQVPLLLIVCIAYWVGWNVFSIAFTTLVVEETGAWEALRLAAARTRPILPRILGGSFVMGLVVGGVSMFVMVPAFIFAMLIPIIGSLVQMVVQMAFLPFVNAWVFVVYGNTRDLAEGV